MIYHASIFFTSCRRSRILFLLVSFVGIFGPTTASAHSCGSSGNLSHPFFGDTALPRRWRPCLLKYRHRDPPSLYRSVDRGGASATISTSYITEFPRTERINISPLPLSPGGRVANGLLSIVRISRSSSDDASFAPSYLTITRQNLSDAVGCNLRDLRVLSNNGSASIVSVRMGSCFLARPRGIIVHVRNVRAVILHGEVWIVVPNSTGGDGDDPETAALVTELVENLNDISASPLPSENGRSNSRLSQSSPSFVLATLEILLAHIAAAETTLMNTTLSKALQTLGDIAGCSIFDSSRGKKRMSFIKVQSKLQELLPLKNHVDRLEATCKDVCSALSEILRSDEDMANMLKLGGSGLYIDKQLAVEDDTGSSLSRSNDEHMEVELLFEDYLLQIDEIHATVQDVQNQVTNTEEVVEIELDLMRNRIMRTELLLEMSALVIGAGAAITGLFGLNLISHVELHPTMFWIITASIVAMMSVMGIGLFSHLQMHNIL